MDEPEKQPDARMSSGRLFALFLGIVVLCAIFFGLGAILRRNSGQSDTAAQPATSTRTAPVVTESKPSAASSQPPATEPNTNPAGNEPAPAKEKEEPAPGKSSPPAVETKSSPPPVHPPAASSGAGIVVQIAAVTRQEDADALAEALRQKSYPVFIVTNPPADRLFHVQVGPFHSLQEAESMRDRLARDGYKAILKK
jgi:cell division septation protein DedD